MNSFEFGARFITSPSGVAILCGAIALWALVAYLRFRNTLSPLRREMDGLCEVLDGYQNEEDLASRFGELDERAATTSVMGHQWPEFRKTLIDPAIDDQRQVLYSSQSAAGFFTRDSLLGERMNLRMYNALPNLLTGMGILGTFVGLVAGIYLAGTGLANPDEAQAALGYLLGGASLAFLTSIVGLTTSIFFSSAEKRQLHRFEQQRQRWINALDSRLPRVSVELLTRDGLSESRRQTELLGGFTEQLAFQLNEALERTVPKALEAQVAQPLTEALSKLQASVDGMAQNQAQTNEDTLREIVEKFSNSITGAAGEEMREFGSTMKLMGTQINQQIQAITEQQDSVRKQSEEPVGQLAKVFQEGAEGLQQRVAASVNEILDGLGSAVRDMSELLDAAGGRMAVQLDATATAFGNTVGTLNSSVDEIRNILTGANQLMEYTDQLITATRHALSSADDVSKSIDTSAQALDSAAKIGAESATALHQSGQAIADATSAFQESQGRVEAVWGDYQKRFATVDDALGKTFTELDTGLQSYSRNIREFMGQLDEHTGKITSSLAGAVEDLSGGIEDLGDVLSRRAA